MFNVTIREARLNDLSQMVQLYSGWQEFKGVLPDELIAPEAKDHLAPFLSGIKADRKYIIAINENQNLVGICYLDLFFESLQVFRIGDFIVEKEYRHKGIGKKMLKYIINYAREKHIKKLWLWTQEELEDAINFYQTNGFSVEGKQKAQFLGKDAILLGLVL